MIRFFCVFFVMLTTVLPCDAKSKKPPSDDSAFDERLYSPLNEAQFKVVIMTTMARIAGGGDRCPRYEVNEIATFQELASANITSSMIKSQGFENAESTAIASAVERMNEDQSEWCLAVWKLFGPHGIYRRQMLDAK